MLLPILANVLYRYCNVGIGKHSIERLIFQSFKVQKRSHIYLIRVHVLLYTGKYQGSKRQ